MGNNARPVLTDEAFCVVCGKSGVKLFDALCADCLAAKVRPITLPPQLRVIVCPFCGARLYGRHWEKGPPPGFLQGKDLEGHLTVHPPFTLKSVTWEEGGQNPKLRQYSGLAVVELGGSSLEVRLQTEVKVQHQVCPHCSRRGGKFYTAKLQLRADEDVDAERDLAEFRESVILLWNRLLARSSKSWSEAIAWDEVLKEGVDVYFTETSVAKVVAKELRSFTGAQTKESASLWGVKDGRQVYRTTVLLRLPPILPGDFLDLDGRLVQVRRRTGDRLQVTDVGSGEAATKKIEGRRFPGRIVGGQAALQWATVVPGDRGYVLDPASGDRLRLVNPLSEEATRSTEVPIVRDGGDAWWTPRLSPRK
jgi:nonsense-mediated mRNA decay protein 3